MQHKIPFHDLMTMPQKDWQNNILPHECHPQLGNLNQQEDMPSAPVMLE
jgi:hypothetical protein